MTARTIPADFVRRSLELSARSGVDLSPALSAAGITTASLEDPLARLTPTQVTAFTQAVWQITGDELFGLGPAPVPRGTFRLVCLALIHTADLSAALERMADILRALPSLPALHIGPGVNGGTRMTIDIRSAAAERSTEDVQSSLEATRVTTDFLLILLHRFAAWLVGKRVRLLAVELPYPAPLPHLAENYDHIFGVPVTFDSDIPAVEFDNAVMRAPIIQTEETLEDYLRESPTLLMSERDYDSTASAQVRRVLELGMKGRTSTAEDIAEMLSISVPHLRRLLRQEGTSLNQLREEVLRDAAVAGLRRGETVEDLSARLGFSEPSAFRRAFKRWTGSTPSSYRGA
ncbi:AraC-like DNA-binding protein [Rhodococcus percolatus]|uniref:AraC family transcriptional regulator n=1 Tax=Rhodococcus opacus TaxID=37919 RepID=UPI0015F9323A|nr:AraC family transcriptional regulator [Rhodococcus opacus]MBA8958829.1 AraC-like DNA-binding protein [Rhodococcus opacus]MBP2204394.1 AraC-like DNA-binding protein [Rhodococcus opacus]